MPPLRRHANPRPGRVAATSFSVCGGLSLATLRLIGIIPRMLELPLNEPVVVSHVPYVIRRTVKWGECDPAGIVYTPRFLDFVVETAEAWFKEVTGLHWNATRRELGIGSPIVHASLDFHHAVWPEDSLDLTVELEGLTRATYTLIVAGHNADGTLCFRGKLVGALTDYKKMTSVRIPQDFRSRMEAYGEACAKLEDRD